MFSYPVIEIYKNGKRIDGMIGIRTQTQLQNLIVKNGGYNSKLFSIYACIMSLKYDLWVRLGF